MRIFLISLIAAVAACATVAEEPGRSIHVVYHAGAMEYSIADGGPARVIGADHNRVLEFEASREDFRRIADLLAPLQAEGLTCSSPPEPLRPGYIIWRRGEEEVRRVPMHTACYSDGSRPLARNTDRAWRAMEEMGRARYVAPVIPEPMMIAVERRYWGNPTSGWSVSRSGEGRYTERGEVVRRFAVSEEAFARVREIFRPYESRRFECQRVITDGPYGDVIWSSAEGKEDQRTRFDAGCVTGDAEDLFARLAEADALINALRGAPAE
jgi:hypothetical protein